MAPDWSEMALFWTPGWREGIWFAVLALSLRPGSMGSNDLVIRTGPEIEGFREYCEAEVFQGRCSKDEVIYMRNALYGRMRIGRCIDTNFGYVGCGNDVLHVADWMCSGRPSCMISVPNSDLKRETDCPNDLKPYLELGYECLPVQTGSDQNCKTSRVILPSSTSGYLSNYVTMETMKGSENCPWMIQGRKGQRVNLTVLDFARRSLRPDVPVSEGSEGICRVYAMVRETGKSRSTTVCSGSDRIFHGYISTAHAVEVRILSKKDRHREFFLLKYDIVGCPDPDVSEYVEITRIQNDVALLRCPSTNQKWRLICNGNTWSGTYGNCSQDIHHPTFGEIVWGNMLMSFEVSLTIVVGIAIGIGIIILACGVVCIRSTCKPKKKARKSSKRPVNPVPPLRTPINTLKRANGSLPPKPPPRSPGILSRPPEGSHGPLPPPPPQYQDKYNASTENEYAYISDLPPPPLPTPPTSATVLANPMTSSYQKAQQIQPDTEGDDSEFDYTDPPTPYTSPRHTHYDVGSIRSSDGGSVMATSGYFFQNKHVADSPNHNREPTVNHETSHQNETFTQPNYSKLPDSDSSPSYKHTPESPAKYRQHSESPHHANYTDDRHNSPNHFSMWVNREPEEDAGAPPPTYQESRYEDEDPDSAVPYRFSHSPIPDMFPNGSLQSRYWRNKHPEMFQFPPPVAVGTAEDAGSRTGTL